MKPLVNKWEEVSEAEAKLDGGPTQRVGVTSDPLQDCIILPSGRLGYYESGLKAFEILAKSETKSLPNTNYPRQRLTRHY
jgi:hypothetical protein